MRHSVGSIVEVRLQLDVTIVGIVVDVLFMVNDAENEFYLVLAADGLKWHVLGRIVHRDLQLTPHLFSFQQKNLERELGLRASRVHTNVGET